MVETSNRAYYCTILDEAWQLVEMRLLSLGWYLMCFIVSLCLSHMLPAVFPEDSDADCEAQHPYEHTLHTAWLTDSHGGCLPH